MAGFYTDRLIVSIDADGVRRSSLALRSKPFVSMYILQNSVKSGVGSWPSLSYSADKTRHSFRVIAREVKD